MSQAAWQEEQEPVSNPSQEELATGPGGNVAFLERGTKAVSESPVEEKEEQAYGNTFLANRKPSKTLEQGEGKVETKEDKDAENEKEREEKANFEVEAVELRRPGISPKPVPAPRHFFLRPTSKVANGEFTFYVQRKLFLVVSMILAKTFKMALLQVKSRKKRRVS